MVAPVADHRLIERVQALLRSSDTGAVVDLLRRLRPADSSEILFRTEEEATEDIYRLDHVNEEAVSAASDPCPLSLVGRRFGHGANLVHGCGPVCGYNRRRGHSCCIDSVGCSPGWQCRQSVDDDQRTFPWLWDRSI